MLVKALLAKTGRITQDWFRAIMHPRRWRAERNQDRLREAVAIQDYHEQLRIERENLSVREWFP